MKKVVSEEVKIALDGILTEIGASKVLCPKSEADKVWNQSRDHAIEIIRKYQRGEGLFQ